MSNTMPFESQVANITHEQWLYSEAQKMLETKGLGAENLCTWQGSVYGAFDIESDDIYERAEQDWGLSQLGENGEEELPSLIIQSCWAHEYKHMFNEMQEWIQRGAGVVQMAILLKWTLEIPDPGADPVLHSEIEVFEYAPKTEAQYRRTFHETVSSTEEKELQSVKITARQLFGGHKPRGRGASYALSLIDLWYTALDIFDAEVEGWNTQGQLQTAVVGEFGQVTVAAQGPGELQVDEEEYETDEEEENEVDSDTQNGADELLWGTSTSALKYELPTTTTTASASAGVHPAPLTSFHAAAIAVMAATKGSQAEEGTGASGVAHTGRAVDEDALTLEFEGEAGRSIITRAETASTTQHPQTTIRKDGKVFTTTKTTTVVHQSSPQSIEPTAIGTSENLILTHHSKEMAEAVGIDDLLRRSRGAVPQVRIALNPELCEGINNEAVFETDSDLDSDGEGAFDHRLCTVMTRGAVPQDYEVRNNEAGFEADSESDIEGEFDPRLCTVMTRAAAPENEVRSTHVHRKISTEGGTVPVTGSHTEEYTITEHTSTLPSGSYEHFQEGITQSSYTHKESAEEVNTPPKTSSYGHYQESVNQSSYTHEESAEKIITPPKTSRLEVSITQDSGSANAKTETFGVEYDQTLMLQKDTTTYTSMDSPCPHCHSEQCCHGPQSPLRHLPRDFMSAGVIGPFSWCGFVVYLSLSTLQPIPQEAIKKSRPALIERIQEFNEDIHEELHEEFPPEDVGALTLITVEPPMATGKTSISKTTITTETTKRRKKRDRNHSPEVPTEATGTKSSLFTPSTYTSPESIRGVFQSPKPSRPTPFGLWDTIPAKPPTQPPIQPFPGFAPLPDPPSVEIHKPVDTAVGDRPKVVTEVNKVVDVGWQTSATKTEGLGIIIEPQPAVTEAVDTKPGPKVIEEVARAETVITQETTRTNISGKSPKPSVTGELDSEISHSGTMTTEKHIQIQTTKDTNATGEAQSNVPKTAGDITKTEVTEVTEKGFWESSRVGGDDKISKIGTGVSGGEVISVGRTIDTLPEQPKATDVPVIEGEASVTTVTEETTLSVTEVKETEAWERSSNVATFEPDGEEVQGGDIFVEDKPGFHPGLGLSFNNDSVQSFESFESSYIPGPEGTTKPKRSKREKLKGVLAKTIDAVKPGKFGRRKKNSAHTGLESASEVTLATEDDIGPPTPTHSGRGVAVIPQGIVQQKMNSFGQVRRQSGSSTLLERPRFQLQRAYSTGGRPSEEKHTEPLTPQSTTTTIHTSWGRSSGDSTFSHPIGSDNGSIETAPPLTPGIGDESGNVSAGKRKKFRKGRYTKTTRDGTTVEASGSGDDMDSDGVEDIVHDTETHSTTTLTGTTTTIVHASDCQYSDSTGLGSLQCDCGGKANRKAQNRESAITTTVVHISTCQYFGSTGLGSVECDCSSKDLKTQNRESTTTTTVVHTSTCQYFGSTGLGSVECDCSSKDLKTQNRESISTSVMVHTSTCQYFGFTGLESVQCDCSGKDLKTQNFESISTSAVVHTSTCQYFGSTGLGQVQCDCGKDLITQTQNRESTSSTAVVHTSTCQYSHSTGFGLVQCDCGGEELIKHRDPPPPEPTSTADLMAQLQSLLTQLQGRTGKVVVPRLGVNMTCEIAETEEEEVEVEVEVRVKYKSKKTIEHVGFCERTRGLLGAGGTCPIIEEMMGRA